MYLVAGRMVLKILILFWHFSIIISWIINLKVDRSRNNYREVSKLSINTDVSGVSRITNDFSVYLFGVKVVWYDAHSAENVIGMEDTASAVFAGFCHSGFAALNKERILYGTRPLKVN